MAEKIKKLGQQENKTFNPSRYTNEIQWVNCLLPVQIDNSGRLGENIIIWENADVRGEGAVKSGHVQTQGSKMGRN